MAADACVELRRSRKNETLVSPSFVQYKTNYKCPCMQRPRSVRWTPPRHARSGLPMVHATPAPARRRRSNHHTPICPGAPFVWDPFPSSGRWFRLPEDWSSRRVCSSSGRRIRLAVDGTGLPVQETDPSSGRPKRNMHKSTTWFLLRAHTPWAPPGTAHRTCRPTSVISAFRFFSTYVALHKHTS